jgi:EAL and modified HD-GYP domain-containing signal transduction protein
MRVPCIARQPILGRSLHVYGYELLFRDPDSRAPEEPLGDRATARVMVDALMDIGLDRVAGRALALVNVTSGLVMSDIPLLLPPARVALELLEGATAEPELLHALGRLRESGYRIFLDDFAYADAPRSLLRLADGVKVEVNERPREELEREVELLRPFGVTLVAEKVETHRTYAVCEELGFDYFQGFFFAEPNPVPGASVAVSVLTKLRLALALQRPGAELEDLERIIAKDAALAYRLLRYLNSAYFSLPRTLRSVREALVVLGVEAVQRWATVVVFAGIEAKTDELLALALIRARMCELLAQAAGAPTHGAFLVGLLSVLDGLTDLPLGQAVAELPLSDELVAALLAHEGPQGDILSRVLAYERGELERAVAPPLDPGPVGDAYVGAVAFASSTMFELR